MPTYEYRCVSCEHQFERFQRMSDDPVKECEVCGEPVKRLLFPVAIHFKGSGFYSTDYAHRNSHAAGGNGNGGSSEGSSSETSSSSESPSSTTSSSTSGSSEGSNEKKSESKPADKAPSSVGASTAKTS